MTEQMQEIDPELAEQIRGGNQLPPCFPDPSPGPTFPTQPPADPYWPQPQGCW